MKNESPRITVYMKTMRLFNRAILGIALAYLGNRWQELGCELLVARRWNSRTSLLLEQDSQY